ncbi:D-alpha,beta-D-heptose 1,7-bisphosphate phosphatase [Longilinea arvoryzae]|uniref:D,D-heptose 1,7-bisphosphate phosphatase n=1 Tax=Longilinea arvoryzae TaxID=360412 RepID=A0A0S7BEQ6_9CHLR|nr:HAD-IIIA family hydrolase [Longilinea arvoryzae]GAP13440.1 D-alpha,beta-D-heptose 1,7-bisphosphate phosphatase [Longilinea arvoryzae]
MDPAIFLDRDGVIIENREDYVLTWEDIEFFPAALEALRDFRSSPFRIVLITNQSAVGRGLITLQQALELNQRVTTTVEQAGGRLDGTWMCPHAPEDHCVCRKPRPGLLLQAAEALHLDLSRSYMIGDALSDLQAGRAAGVRETILVRTGRGARQACLPEAALLRPFPTFDSLAEALDHISSQSH